MTLFFRTCLFLTLLTVAGAAHAAPPALKDGDLRTALVPHKALYDIDLVATRSGSQIINISGRMFYEWKPSCEAWVTDHRFTLFYEYADSPGMRITSDFSTYEPFDGKTLDFTSRRKRDSDLYQELRGHADTRESGGAATYTLPQGLKYDLRPGTLFPMRHTVEMVKKAREGKKFFSAQVFDGSDEEGPIEINTFIGKPVNAMKEIKPSKDLDMTLLNTPAWSMRMAVFPLADEQEASSDYEMSLIFHDNGVISDMMIEYDDFTVSQKLVALERLEPENCDSAPSDKIKKK